MEFIDEPQTPGLGIGANCWEVRLAVELCRRDFKTNASPRAPGSFNRPPDSVKDCGNLRIMPIVKHLLSIELLRRAAGRTTACDYSSKLHPARVPLGTGFSGTAKTGVIPSE